MIGQHNLQSRIMSLIEKDRFPRFSILVGPKGSGRKTFVKFIRYKFRNVLFADIGIGVDSIRDIIVNAYKTTQPIIYLIADADNMSNAAKNALLKVTEEPPNNAYFIMTLEDENNTLETIRSRATIFHMDRYTSDEILEYAIDRFRNELQDQKSRDIIKELCETPGDVQTLYKANILAFYEYVRLVFDNIAEVSIANSFKIPSKVALKDDADGYDLRLFWKAFMNICLHENKVDGIYITSKYLAQLRIKGINKQMAMDNWILEIREAWA